MINTDGGPAQLVAKHSDGPDWSPDGNLLPLFLLTDAPIGQNTRLYMQIFDVRTGKTSEVLGLTDRRRLVDHAGHADGRSLHSDKFLTFSFKTQRWLNLSPATSLTGRSRRTESIWSSRLVARNPRHGVSRFADRRVETITSLKGLRRVGRLARGSKLDVASDGSPVFCPRHRRPEIYALNVRWP